VASQRGIEHDALMGTPEDRPTLLAVEDDPRLGPLLLEALGDAYEVRLVADGTGGLAAALTGDFDVAVVDRRLPGLDGVALVSELRRAGSAMPVLMLTALGRVPDRVSGLDAGADDYLVKPFDFDELHARLRALLRNHGAPATRIGEWELVPARNAIESPYEGRVALTPRETALLELLAAEPERAFSRATILRRVFDPDAGAGTVDTYVHAIRRKTERDLIETVRGQGYRIGLR
jgi:two-component system response regulator QseB